MIPFCSAAAERFDGSSLATDGSGVVDDLRTIDVAGLSDSDGQRFVAAIDRVEAMINAYRASGQMWSTQPAADVASQICGVSMDSFSVVA